MILTKSRFHTQKQYSHRRSTRKNNLEIGRSEKATQPIKTKQRHKHLTQENAQSHLHPLLLTSLNACVNQSEKRRPKTQQAYQKAIPNALPYG
jgi:hypothetical protein